jgi:hypothetical protein
MINFLVFSETKTFGRCLLMEFVKLYPYAHLIFFLIYNLHHTIFKEKCPRRLS